MISYFTSLPSLSVLNAPQRTYNFNIKELAPDDPRRAEGYTHSAYPITVQASVSPAEALMKVVSDYDSSPAVNGFMLNGNNVWIDKATRVGLMNSIGIERAAGREMTTLWFGGYAYTIPCDIAINLLSAIELYALQCYTITAEHQHQVSVLGDAFTAAQDHYSALLNHQSATVPDDSSSGSTAAVVPDGHAAPVAGGSAVGTTPTSTAADLQSARTAQQAAFEAILGFDFTLGYPDKLSINV